jgi:integrase
VVPLLKSIVQALSSYLNERKPDSPFVFPGKTKTGYAEKYNMEKALKRVCMQPFTPHQLSRLYATEMPRNGT